MEIDTGPKVSAAVKLEESEKEKQRVMRGYYLLIRAVWKVSKGKESPEHPVAVFRRRKLRCAD